MASRSRRRAIQGFGVALVAITAAGVGYPLWWNHRSEVTGRALIVQAQAQIVNPHVAKSVQCPSTATAAARPIGSTPGILEVPSIGLIAPVLNGLSDAVLNVAVGHDPSTIWPGASGESIVEAHDVSYFSALSQVRVGQPIIWITACARSQFRVLKTAVRQPGDFVYVPSSGAGLALITCYPTNALFWTSKRFVVTTQLISSQVGRQALPTISDKVPALRNLAPPALVAEGLALNQNALLMGVLQIAGSPATSFTAGPAPLAVEADALSVFFGAEKAVRQRNASWWADLTYPGVPFRSSWPSFSQANVKITVDKTAPISIVISSGASSVTIVNQQGVLRISNVA